MPEVSRLEVSILCASAFPRPDYFDSCTIRWRFYDYHSAGFNATAESGLSVMLLGMGEATRGCGNSPNAGGGWQRQSMHHAIGLGLALDCVSAGLPLHRLQ
jgi:hypothetical protein